mgnify:FL=1
MGDKVKIEFHDTCASLGVRLWQIIPTAWLKKRNEKAWASTIEEVKWIVKSRLNFYGYTSYRWIEQFDKTFIIPLKDGKKIKIKKRDNTEHYQEEKDNLEKFRRDIENILTKEVPLIYEAQLSK